MACRRCGNLCTSCERKPHTCIDCGAPAEIPWVRCEIHRAQLTAQGLEQQNRELHQAIAKRNRKIADLEARLLSISKEKTQHDDPDGPP